MSPSVILQFWFEETAPRQWWRKDPAFDQLIRQRFADVHAQAARCELFHWRAQPAGRLAEIILLDQFSRNLYRDRAEAFAHDALALALAQEAVAQGCDQPCSALQRSFFYMPYMHSESARIHQEALALFRANGLSDNLDFEIRHKAIIDRFGRYPHRNQALGRTSSAEEIAFLQQPGSHF